MNTIATYKSQSVATCFKGMRFVNRGWPTTYFTVHNYFDS